MIAGATGYLGHHIVKEFKKRGFLIRALARNTGKLNNINDHIDEVVIGEVTDSDSIRGICKDMDIVFSSIGITKQKDNKTYFDVDYLGNKNLLEEAKKEGISKFVYTSVFNAEKMRNLKGVQAKLKFAKDLKESGVNYLIINPNGFFSDMLAYLKMAKKGRGYVFGSGNNKINPIHGEDLAKFCANAIDGEEKEINVGGPDILTHNEILTIAFESLAKEVTISRIPTWLRNCLLKTLRTFTSIKTYGPIEFFMTVLAVDMVAPTYGKHHLREYFIENRNKVLS